MATLKISDLSVGDWVALEAADLSIEHGDIATAFVEEVLKPVCVQSILGDDKLVFARTACLEAYGTIYVKEEMLRPIPITPEILEANGFENMGSGLMRYEFELREKKYKIILGSLDEEVWFADFYFLRKKNIDSNIPLFYIHQLQHILRLAGVEKEINFKQLKTKHYGT